MSVRLELVTQVELEATTRIVEFIRLYWDTEIDANRTHRQVEAQTHTDVGVHVATTDVIGITADGTNVVRVTADA